MDPRSPTPVMRLGPALALLAVLASGPVRGDYSVTVTVDPDSGQTPISPYIYGTNQDLEGVVPMARRIGGNRMTGYNWENNASNAGSDWYHNSDNYLTWAAGLSSEEESTPGIVLTHFHDQSLADGVSYSLITLPMAGYVAADKNGIVAADEAAPSSRWVPVIDTKPTDFSSTPALDDGAVYSDELVAFLVSRYGDASTSTGVRGYDLDNEPGLWASTHARLHPTAIGCAELVNRSTSLASAIKRVDPAAETFGFVSYGFSGYYDLQGATDWSTEREKGGGSYRWFVDYFLDQMRQSSDAAGVRLLDVLDMHDYTEHQAGDERVCDPSEWSNTACNLGRMQAPRGLWDPTFVENSWIGTWFSDYMPFIPNLQDSIDTFYPGTKLSFSEYCFGGESHISGGIAQADALGIFGREGVYFATFWQLHDDPTYIAAAFQLYLSYDGAGGCFGDTAVAVTNPAASDDLSVYASVNATDDGTLHLVLLNKSDTDAAQVTVQLSGDRTYASGRVFAFDDASATLTERTAIDEITDNMFTYTVPALTAAHVVLEAASETTTPAVINLSTRGFVGTEDEVMIAGFVIGGSGEKTILLRAVGPTLGIDPFNIVGVLADPRIRLTQADGTPITTNDDWDAGETYDAAAMEAYFAQSGAFSLARGSGDAALVLSLPAGAYTAIVSGADGGTGIAIAEIYDLEPASTAQLINLSTRARAGTGDEVMICGFIIEGSDPIDLLLRAVGPQLGQSPFGLSGVLANPWMKLTLPDGTPVDSNTDWGADADAAAAVAAAGAQVWAFTLDEGSQDAALLTSHTQGSYTAIIRGEDGGTGIALGEIYVVP